MATTVTGGLFHEAYVPPARMEALRSYKYSGVDHSILSNYVMQPYWSRLVLLFPLWMAPNMITLLGLLFEVINIATLMYFSPDLQADCPPWVYFSFSIGLFLYTSFDAVDGKQARRTGSSSPLGELFDHSCDAISTVLLAILMAHTTGVGQGWLLYINVFLSVMCFYVTTWETYHTHTLYLGYINGPVDGTLGLCVLFFFTGVYSREMWAWPVKWVEVLNIPGTVLDGLFVDWQFRHVGYTLFTLFSVFTVLVSMNNVRRATGSLRAFARSLRGLFPLALWTATSLAWVAYSRAGILHDGLVALSLAIGIEFAMMVQRILLAHLTHGPYPYYQPGLLYLTAIGAAVALPHLVGFAPWVSVEAERALLVVYLLGTLATYIHMSVSIVNQFCEFLKIRCLQLGPATHSA